MRAKAHAPIGALVLPVQMGGEAHPACVWKRDLLLRVGEIQRDECLSAVERAAEGEHFAAAVQRLVAPRPKHRLVFAGSHQPAVEREQRALVLVLDLDIAGTDIRRREPGLAGRETAFALASQRIGARSGSREDCRVTASNSQALPPKRLSQLFGGPPSGAGLCQM
jgi:hypothetical protein